MKNSWKDQSNWTNRISKLQADILTDETLLDVEEISMATRQIKSGRVAGPENITAEAVYSDRDDCIGAPRSIQ